MAESYFPRGYFPREYFVPGYFTLNDAAPANPSSEVALVSVMDFGPSYAGKIDSVKVTWTDQNGLTLHDRGVCQITETWPGVSGEFCSVTYGVPNLTYLARWDGGGDPPAFVRTEVVRTA